MPDDESTSWDTVPEGLTQVIALLGFIPSFSASSLFVLRATSRKCSSSSLPSAVTLLSRGQSMIPVMDTPNRRSSWQFSVHMGRMCLNLVKLLCHVPRVVATATFCCRVYG